MTKHIPQSRWYWRSRPKSMLRKKGQEWIVYYSERGKQFDIKRFSTENEACEDILKRLVVKYIKYTIR